MAGDDIPVERRSAERREAQRIFELRLLRLEQENDDKEQRLRLLEKRDGAVTEKLTSIDRIEHTVEGIKESQNRLMVGIILAVITVLGTFLLEHFGPVAHG